MTKTKPLTISPDQIRAALAGRLHQVRIPIEPQPIPCSELGDEEYRGPVQHFIDSDGSLRASRRYGSSEVKPPLGTIGDRLECDGITFEITGVRVERDEAGVWQWVYSVRKVGE